MTPPIPPENRIRFDKTINLGHLLTVGAFLLTAMVQWNMMDKRVLVLEESRTSQRERDTSQDAVQRERDNNQDATSKDNFLFVKEALTDLRRSVEKVADKVGASK